MYITISFNISWFLTVTTLQQKEIDCYFRPQDQDERNTVRVESNTVNILRNIICIIKKKEDCIKLFIKIIIINHKRKRTKIFLFMNNKTLNDFLYEIIV